MCVNLEKLRIIHFYFVLFIFEFSGYVKSGCTLYSWIPLSSLDYVFDIPSVVSSLYMAKTVSLRFKAVSGSYDDFDSENTSRAKHYVVIIIVVFSNWSKPGGIDVIWTGAADGKMARISFQGSTFVILATHEHEMGNT